MSQAELAFIIVEIVLTSAQTGQVLFICSFHGGSSEEFPIMAQAYVKVKCAASALRVRSKEAFQFGMEISVGDASMQADMTVAPKVIEHHIGTSPHLESQVWTR